MREPEIFPHDAYLALPLGQQSFVFRKKSFAYDTERTSVDNKLLIQKCKNILLHQEFRNVIPLQYGKNDQQHDDLLK